jgi:enterochelin esterase-like enzyme
VAVLVDNPDPPTRVRELTPNPDFPEFLVSELLPWVHSRYNVTTNPRLTVVAGSSFGGLAATYAALRHPERFGNVLCQSGDFSWAPDHIHVMGRLADATTETGWFAKELIRSPKLPIRFHMDAGTFEVDQVGTGGNVLETSRHMRDVLLARGYEVHYQQFVGDHDYLSWRGTLADGLIELMGR